VSIVGNRGRTVFFIRKLRLFTILLYLYRIVVILIAATVIAGVYVLFPRIPSFKITGFDVAARPNSSAQFNTSDPSSLFYFTNGTINFTLHNPNFYELTIINFYLIVSYGPLPFGKVVSESPTVLPPGQTVPNQALFEVKINLTDVAYQLETGGPMEKFLLQGFLPTLFQALFEEDFEPAYAGNITFSYHDWSLNVDVSGVTDVKLSLGFFKKNATSLKPLPPAERRNMKHDL